MTETSVLWFLAGLLCGATHGYGLWRATKTPSHAAMWYVPRMLFTGGVLLCSALLGGILPAAVGWSVGYFAAVGWFAVRAPA